MSGGVESTDVTAINIAVIFMSAAIEILRVHPIIPEAERHISVEITLSTPKPDLKEQVQE